MIKKTISTPGIAGRQNRSTTSSLSSARTVAPGRSTLLVHSDDFSVEELVLAPEVIPDAKVGEIIEISQSDSPENRLYLRLTSSQPVKGGTQLSVRKSIAEAFGLQPRKEATVRVASAEDAELEFVELSFKDQFISRSDMWRFTLHLAGQPAYDSKLFSWSGMRCVVKHLMRSGRPVLSGLITKRTKFTFRSRSAALFWMVHLTREMWEYAPDGDLHFEKAVNGFCKEVFTRWRSNGVNHSLSIVFFTRLFYDTEAVPEHKRESLLCTEDGRWYEDVYKVVFDRESGAEWDAVLVQMKKEFLQFPALINWDPNQEGAAGTPRVHNSSAEDSNFLEAINLVLDVFDKHHLDRDLSHTGQQMTVLSAGSGVFRVDPAVSRMTKERMMANGIGCDLVCLQSPPLHTVPLFHYVHKQNSVGLPKVPANSFHIPHWIHVTFYTNNTFGNPVDNHRFVPCKQKSPTSQNGGLRDLLPVSTDVDPPWLQRSLSFARDFANHDEKLFKIPACPGQLQHQALVDHMRMSTASLRSLHSMSMRSGRRSSGDGRDPSYDRLHQSTDTLNLLAGSPGSHGESGFLQGAMLQVSSGRGDHALSPVLSPALNTLNGVAHSTKTKPPSSGQLAHTSAGKHHRLTPKFVNPFHVMECKCVECAEVNTQTRVTSNRRRWSHLFPHAALSDARDMREPHWTSQCDPACLPLTTDYWPSTVELNKNYVEYGYNVINYEPEYIKDPTMAIRELVCQRLHQGFQLVMSEDVDGSHQPTDSSGANIANPSDLSASVVDMNANGGSRGALVYRLSLGHQFHLLQYDPNSPDGPDITIKRYIRRLDSGNAMQLPYSYTVLNPRTQCLESARMVMSSLGPNDYNWNFLDQFICGDEESMTDMMRYRRIRFALMPLEPVGADGANRSKILESFKKFRDSAFSRVLKPIEGAKIEILTEMDVKLETPAKDHIGTEKSKRRSIPFLMSPKRSKSDLLHGQTPDDSQGMLDVPPDVTPVGSLSDLLSTSHHQPRHHLWDGSSPLQMHVPMQSAERRRVKLERETPNPERHEWAYLEHDTFFDPRWALLLELQWLVCCGSFIDEFVQGLTRRARSFGFVLCQVPCVANVSIANPLRTRVSIPYPKKARESLCRLLSTQFDFLPARVTPSEPLMFVHRSGLAVTHVTDDAVIWTDNPRVSPSMTQVLADLEKCCWTMSIVHEMMEIALSCF